MTTWIESNAAAADVIDVLLRDDRTTRSILDFGCGAGQLVRALRERGYDTHGCDIAPPVAPGLRPIVLAPYRLPYADASFDVVVSTSVFEHAQNTDECFREIHRVLRPGGRAIHFIPGKWYLPTEPHIFVPLVSWFWPHVPRWWLSLWAFLGVRNAYQRGQHWRAVRDANAHYCATGLAYWSTRRYRALSDAIFGAHEYPMRAVIAQGGGGYARLAKRLPRWTHGLLGALSRECRMGVLVQRKVRSDVAHYTAPVIAA